MVIGLSCLILVGFFPASRGAGDERGQLGENQFVHQSENSREEKETRVLLDLFRSFLSGGTFTVGKASTNGSIADISSHVTFSAAKAEMQKLSKAEKNALEAGSYVVRSGNKVIAMTKGIAAILTSSATLSFDNLHGGVRPYVTNQFTAFYYDTVSPDEVRVGVGGITGSTKHQNLMLIPMPHMAEYASEDFKKTNTHQINYYERNSAGDLLHRVTTMATSGKNTISSGGMAGLITVDKAPGFMKIGVRYYSMDGVNFFTDPFLGKKAGTYYPYYQFLSFRSKTAYTASELNSYIKNNLSSKSALQGQGSALIKAQDDFGINALLELAFACHESGGGTSSYAINRNNLFGINAIDSDPDKATYFSSVQACIRQHSDDLLSQKYFDALSDGRYFGSCPGNKAVGINVRYASDPAHGQKIAGWAYRIDKALGGKDRLKYDIGITKKSVPVYITASGSNVLYTMRNNRNNADLSGLPVVILGKSGKRYKIRSDMPITDKTANCKGKWEFKNSVGYVDTALIENLNTGIKPSKTSGGNAKAVKAKSVALSWSKASGAKGYEIEASTSKSKNFQVIQRTTSTSFTHSKLKSGQVYYYRVRSYRTVDEGRYYSGYSSTFSAATHPAKTKGLKADPTGFTRGKLTWTMVSGASGYEIQRSTKSSGFITVKTLKNGSKTSFTNKKLKTNTTYTYRVRAYKTHGGRTLYGSYSAKAKLKPGNVRPSKVKVVSDGAKSVKITWKQTSGASGYEIYRSLSKKSSYKKIKTIKKVNVTSFTNKKLKTGRKYYYKVLAYTNSGKKKITGKQSAVVSAVPKLKK